MPDGQLAEHPFVQQVVVGAVEREPRDFSFDAHLHELKFFDFRRDQRQRSEDFDTCSALLLMRVHVKSLRSERSPLKPLKSTSKRLDRFDFDRHAQSAGHTQCGKTPPASPRTGLLASPLSRRPPHLVNQSRKDAAAGARNRMPQRDRAAIGIQPLAIEVQIAVAGQHLRGKSFVQLDRVVIFHFRAGAFAQIAHRGHGTDAHHARIHRRNRSRPQFARSASDSVRELFPRSPAPPPPRHP